MRTKGRGYAGIYPTRERDDFTDFLKQLSDRIDRARLIENETLRNEVGFTLFYEAVNHLAWRMHLAYQAVGARDEKKSIEPREIEIMKTGLHTSPDG